MTTQHTPGPWRYKNRDLVIHDRPVRGAVVTKVRRGSTTIVAELIGRSSEANARLIAAAPELLEALKHIQGVAMADEWRDLPEIAKHARAAIAKAEGGAA